MGLLSYLRGRSEARSIPSYGVPWGWWPTGVTQTGQLATPHLAENLATVCACVGAVSSAVASNPVIVYRKTDAGRTELPQHPVARLIASPWQMLTWVDWCEWLLSQVLLNGNAIAEIVHDGRGVVTGLRPIPWHNVNPIALPTGRMAFDVSIWPEPRRRLLQDQVFYLRDRSDDGWVGRSRISRAPDVIGAAASLQAFSAYAWENQATPSGAIQIEGTLNDATYSRLRARLAEGVEGRRNAKRLLVLELWREVDQPECQPRGRTGSKLPTVYSRRIVQTISSSAANYSRLYAKYFYKCCTIWPLVCTDEPFTLGAQDRSRVLQIGHRLRRRVHRD